MQVIQAAKEHFDLDALKVEIVEMDALHFLRKAGGGKALPLLPQPQEQRHFDLIIDDIFVGYARSVQKPRWLPRPGLALAKKRLSPGRCTK